MKTKTLFLVTLAIVFSAPCFAGQNIKKYTVSQSAMLNRLMAYLAIESPSDDKDPKPYPMTEGQKEMAAKLLADAKALNVDVTLSEWGYVYVTIPSNIDREVPTIGISCHLDYTPEAPGHGIKPKVIKYKGGPLDMGHNTIDPSSQAGKDLPKLVGKTLIHADGTTILGGDDKNGCAIVMSVIETAAKNGFKHGKLQFVFSPNEDIGMAALKIDPTYFNPDILVDVDGWGGREIAIGNFTARKIAYKFISHDAHPSAAKEQHMGDALAAASTFIARVPLKYRPEHTEGQQGYIHPWSMEKEDKDINNYTVETRIRFFDKAEGEEFDRIVKDNIRYVQEAFPYVTIQLVNDETQYDNVAYTMHEMSIPLVKKAAARCKIGIDLIQMRAGTTAAMFSAKGLKGGMCLFSGQHNEHSINEFSVLEEMYDAYMLLLTMIDEVTMMK